MANRIKLTEKDLTVISIEQNSVNDVVYIPGFASKADAPTQEAIYCRTVAEFESTFGDVIPTFSENITYPTGFTDNATGNNTSSSDGENEPTSDAVNYMFKAGEYDPSYVMARELLIAGIPVYYRAFANNKSSIASADVAGAYTAMSTAIPDATPAVNSDIFTELLDTGYFNVKYITSGGYPTFEYNGTSNNAVAGKMIQIAQNRGDAIAFIDHTNYKARSLDPSDITSVFYQITAGDNKITDINGFGTMFTPWCEYSTASAGIVVLPGSFAYLISLAKSIRTNPSWLAIAGAARGVVPGLVQPITTVRLSNRLADWYSYCPANDAGADQEDTTRGVGINAISDYRPYGQTILGNRTLKQVNDNVLTALCFLNLRNLVCDVKKQLRYAAKACMFEQNTDVLWSAFKSRILPLLDQMVSGVGISGYKVIREACSDKTKIKSTVRLYPLYAVESFDICVELSNEEVSVTEE